MIRSARISTPVRSLVVAGLVTAAASLAACSDSPVAPSPMTPTRTPEAQAGVSLNLGAYIKVRIADTTGATLKETAWVWFYSGKDTLKIRDNEKGDLDPTIGYVKVMVSKTNNYRVEAWPFRALHARSGWIRELCVHCDVDVSGDDGGCWNALPAAEPDLQLRRVGRIRKACSRGDLQPDDGCELVDRPAGR